jgi:hypothetical protein
MVITYFLARFISIVLISTVAGAVVLALFQAIGLQIPSVLIGWLPKMLYLDGEDAYDAGCIAFFLECNLFGFLAYLTWRYIE